MSLDMLQEKAGKAYEFTYRVKVVSLVAAQEALLSAVAAEREACAALMGHLSLDGLGGHELANEIRKRK